MAKQTKMNAQAKAAEKSKPAKKQAPFEAPLEKKNFIMVGVCIVLIALGFILMSGSANVGSIWNEDIFSSTRTVVGPMVALLGFVLMIFAIIYKGKDKDAEPNSEKAKEETELVEE